MEGYENMIDSNETIMYKSGKDSEYQKGYDDCKRRDERNYRIYDL